MTAPASAKLMAALAEDPAARLKWRVMGRLGICPASLRARLLTRRKVLECACHLALDAEKAKTDAPAAEENPNFDMARFRALSGG